MPDKVSQVLYNTGLGQLSLVRCQAASIRSILSGKDCTFKEGLFFQGRIVAAETESPRSGKDVVLITDSPHWVSLQFSFTVNAISIPKA
ncbi:hypothetical protein FF1_006654 [Malus domestica]